MSVLNTNTQRTHTHTNRHLFVKVTVHISDDVELPPDRLSINSRWTGEGVESNDSTCKYQDFYISNQCFYSVGTLEQDPVCYELVYMLC